MIKKISLILLFLTIHLTISLKSTDFCIPKQQKECNESYISNKIKCNTIKCHGTFSYDCGSDICSNNMTECKKYNDKKSFLKNAFRTRIMLILSVSVKQLKEENDFELLNKQIKECGKEEDIVYKFKSADFCLNKRSCRVIIRYRHQKINEKIDCKCPKEQSFKCDIYCTSDSLACDYYKSNKNKQYFQNIISICLL